MKPPFVPSLANFTDSSYFEDVDEAQIERMIQKGSRNEEQVTFEGFSYNNQTTFLKE